MRKIWLSRKLIICIFISNLLQLPPIKAPQMYIPYNNAFGDLFNLWSLFVIAELTEVVRQKGMSISKPSQ